MSLFFTAHSNKVGGSEKSFGRQKMLGTAKPSGVIFFSGQRAKAGTLSYPSSEINLPSKNKGSQTGIWKKRTRGGRKPRKRAVRKVKTNHTAWQAKTYSYLPATKWQGRERVNNGLPRQTVKGRGCDTEEGGCFGNAEAPDDDCCNPAHVWNFSFRVYP